ncbi:MAG: pyrroloquinoline quinone biosynthesis protein PqqB [Acidobacteriaceae bacterium]|nr:pyrroloquinoline quinone biosynthesis protein PqqB [Acidobacteriaceae bacterium]
MLKFKLLGTAAGGGLPQWNCSCSICDLCRKQPQQVHPRLHLQAAVSGQSGGWFLLNASPDLRFQIEVNPELQPSAVLGKRNTPIQGIVLTSADLDQVLGVLLLREFQPLTLYTTALVRRVLEANTFFRMLQRVPQQLTWVEILPDVPFQLGNTGVTCTPIPLQGGLPFYARDMDTGAAGQASLGLLLESDGQRIAYTPSLPEVTEKLLTLYNTCDAILVDGTFWENAELSQTHAGTPLARSIGHVPIHGKQGTIALLSPLEGPQKVFVHINNTNPILDPASEEHKTVLAAGWRIAEDGWQWN